MDIQLTKQQQAMALAAVFFVIVVILLALNWKSLLPPPVDMSAQYAAPTRPTIPQNIDDAVIRRPDFPASSDTAAPIEPGPTGVDDIFGALQP